MKKEEKKNENGNGELEKLNLKNLAIIPPMAKDFTTEIVPIGSLRMGRYQPQDRITVKKLKRLITSIGIYGQQTAVMVFPDLEIIDGHGRWTAMKILGHKTIAINRKKTDIPPDDLFLSMVSTTKKMTNRETLEVYRLGGAVPEDFRKQADLLTKSWIETIYERRWNSNTFYSLVRTLQILMQKSPDFSGELPEKNYIMAGNWLVDHHTPKELHYKLYKESLATSIIIRRIKENKKLVTE